MASRMYIKAGVIEGTSLIGLDKEDANTLVGSPHFAAFVAERGYRTRPLDPDQAPTDPAFASEAYIEVRPPLSARHAAELGALCVRGLGEPGHATPALLQTEDTIRSIVVCDDRWRTPERPHGMSIAFS